jgi:hypothetical protein
MEHRPSAESFRQLTTSVEKLPASMAQQAGISSYATDRARLLLGCYRTGDANDPETYVAAIAATLARYSEAIITAITHPVSGLPSKKSWLPTVKEVHDACEELDDANRQQLARERRIEEQLALREEEDRQNDHRPTLDEMRAKYGPNWGLTPQEPKRADGFKAPNWQAIVSIYQADPTRLRRLMDAANYLHRDAPDDQRPAVQQEVG